MLSLDLDQQGSLQQQLYRSLREAIRSGQLSAGSRLVPSRQLASAVGVSRNTVIAAYEQLCAEGYAESRAGSGTFVTRVQVRPASRSDEVIDPPWSRFTQRLLTNVPVELAFRPARKKLRFNFLYGEPGYLDLPIGIWSRIVGKKARELKERDLDYAPPGGIVELKQQLASYLQRSRGVVCQPDQVIVVQGTQEAVDLVTRAMIDPGSAAVIEEPHYRGFRKCLTAAGARVIATDVDENGIQVDQLKRVKGARVAFVTPSHQFPLGSILSLSRRTALLDWASKTSTLLVEDDYDGEFRYEGKPIACLQSLDQSGSVIYLGTASKILFPSLRLGWMVVPPHMSATFQKLKTLMDTNSSTLEQLAFAEFIEGGHLERHIHRLRNKHKVRRAALLATLDKELGSLVEVVGTGAGIHVLLRFRKLSKSKIQTLIDLAAEQQVGVYSASQYYSKPPRYAELLLGYASLTPQQIVEGIRRLAGVVKSLHA